MAYLILEADGQIARIQNTFDTELDVLETGQTMLESDVPESFPDLMMWSADEQEFVVDLQKSKERKWTEIKLARQAAQDGGCATPLGVMDSDKDSRGLLNGTVTMAIVAQNAGQPFSIAWTMADDSSVVHDGPAIIAAGVAVAQHVAQCHVVGEALRPLIGAAETLAELEAICWPETASA